MISGTSARFTAEVARQSALSNDITTLQTQVSTGKKLAAPSDDPAGNARLNGIRREQADDAAYAANVETASATATRVDAALTSLSASLDQAKTLMTQASSATYSADQRAIVAGQLRGIASDVAVLAAQKDTNGQPLFPAGTAPAIPIGDGQQVQATVSQSALIGTTDAAGDPTDMVAMLNAAADALGIVDDTTRTAATGASLDAIGKAVSQVADVHGSQGIAAAAIDARRTAIADAKPDLADARSAIEDTDVSAAISLITSKMTTLEAAQAVFAKVNAKSLFDMLG